MPGAPESHFYAPKGFVPHLCQRPGEYLQFFRDHARLHIEGELLEDREDIWEQEFCLEYLPTWVTLEVPGDLRNWRSVLREDLQIDKRAIRSFEVLVRKGPRGFHEAARALAHCLKDKKGPGHSSPSQWMQTTCQEALEALESPEMWEQGPGAWGPAKGHGKGRLKGDGAEPGRSSDSGASSSRRA